MSARARLIGAAAILAATAFAADPAHSQNWTVTLDAPNQVAAPGATVVYTGTITNSTGASLSLDAGLDFVASPDAEQFIIDFAPELLALDLVIPTSGYSGPILVVGWTPTATGGSFGTGSLTLGSPSPADPVLIATPFTLGTPGVGPFCGYGTGLMGGANAVASNDPTGNPVIVYSDPATSDLRYASIVAKAWTSVVIATGVGAEAAPALVLDGDMRPHVTFYDALNGDLIHAWDPGTGWQLETVDTTGNVGAQPAIAIDPVGELHVSYCDVTNADLRYAHQSGGVWTTTVVDTAGDVGTHSSIAADAFGQPFISYHDATAGDLKLARSSGSSWLTEVVDAQGTTGNHTSIQTMDGTISISYRDATPASPALEFAAGVPGAWTLEPVDAGADAGFGSSLVLNAFGQPRIAYFDAASSEVRFASRSGTGWVVEAVTTGGTELVSLAMTEDDEPFLSFVDDATGEIRLAALTTCEPLSVPGRPSAGVPGFVLHAPRPNPFRSSTMLSFALPRLSDVRVRVFDAAGRVVAEPFRGTLPAGTHEVTWNGTARSGALLAPGRYLYEVRSGGERRVGRLVLIR